MATQRIKYSMLAKVRYDGRLIDLLDRIRAIRLILMVHIEKDLGEDKELIRITVLTPYPPKDTYYAIRRLCIGKIEELKEMQLQESTLTKLS